MKKIILLTASILFLTFGCSKDDDGPTGSSTPAPSIDLIGTWNLDYYIDNGALTEEIMCSEQVQYVFSNNLTYTQTTFAGTGTSNCLTAVVINGIWSNTGGNDYQLTQNGGSNPQTLNISFQDNFTKFILVVSPTRTEVFAKR